jgi:hypothetical protein
LLEKVIPSLCKAVKLRDHFGNESNEDVANFLTKVEDDIKYAKAVNQSIAQGRGSLDVREASRLQMRLYLARALVAKGKNLRDDSLREFENSAPPRRQNAADPLLNGCEMIFKKLHEGFANIFDEIAVPLDNARRATTS